MIFHMDEKKSRGPVFVMMPDGTVRDISDDAPRFLSLLKSPSGDTSLFLDAINQTIEELEHDLAEEMAQGEEDEHDEESG